MLTDSFINWKALAISLVVLIGSNAASYTVGYVDGKGSCAAKTEKAQKKLDKKAKANHAKIKRSAPGDDDKRATIEWLRHRTRK